jgi:hypothetical protein
MDEKVMELLEQCLFERTQVIYEQILESKPQLREAAKEAALLSEKIEHSITINAENKELLQQFLSLSSEADYEYQKSLYIQGAKDCVEILRELGVIK